MVVFILGIACSAFARECVINPFGIPPEPRLLSPVTNDVDLKGKAYLEFKWLNDSVQVRDYIFKIYKGNNMYASDLIYKQDLPSRESSIQVKADLFEVGKVYTWSLIQVSLGGQKSDKSFSSFQVIKK